MLIQRHVRGQSEDWIDQIGSQCDPGYFALGNKGAFFSARLTNLNKVSSSNMNAVDGQKIEDIL